MSQENNDGLKNVILEYLQKQGPKWDTGISDLAFVVMWNAGNSARRRVSKLANELVAEGKIKRTPVHLHEHGYTIAEDTR